MRVSRVSPEHVSPYFRKRNIVRATVLSSDVLTEVVDEMEDLHLSVRHLAAGDAAATVVVCDLDGAAALIDEGEVICHAVECWNDGVADLAILGVDDYVIAHHKPGVSVLVVDDAAHDLCGQSDFDNGSTGAGSTVSGASYLGRGPTGALYVWRVESVEKGVYSRAARFAENEEARTRASFSRSALFFSTTLTPGMVTHSAAASASVMTVSSLNESKRIELHTEPLLLPASFPLRKTHRHALSVVVWYRG